MSDATDTLLQERGKTHGDYSEHARITQDIKQLYRSFPGWQRLNAEMREAMDMNAHKDGRILAGDPYFKDHWDDKAGYSRLVSKSIPEK